MYARGLLPAGHGRRGKYPVSPLGFSRFLLGSRFLLQEKAPLVGIVRRIRIPNFKRGYGYLPSETVKNREEVRPVNPVERLAWAMFFTEPTGMYSWRVSEGRYPCRRARMAPVFKNQKSRPVKPRAQASLSTGSGPAFPC